MSKTMEYSANDHAISLVARGLGHIHDAERYLERSRNWRNLYDKDYVHRKPSLFALSTYDKILTLKQMA